MAVAYTNNASTTLSATITNSVTSLSVASGAGAKFPSTAGGDHFYITITNGAGDIEIMKVTARSTDTFTVVRGQDGTSAQGWSAGDKIELRLTKAMLDDLKGERALSSHTHAAADITSGTLDNARVNFAAPGTIGSTTPNTGAFTSLSASGNLTLSGSGARIFGDFSNATVANRTLFQTSTSNATTEVGIIPNGTGTASVLNIYPNSDPTNTGYLRLACLSTDARILSQVTGSGTFIPLTFYVNGERMRIDSSGNVVIGLSTASQRFNAINTAITGGGPASSGSASDPNAVARFGYGSVVTDFGAYSNGAAWIQTRAGANYATNYDLVLNPNGGSVGIGTSPGAKLHVLVADADTGGARVSQAGTTARVINTFLNTGAGGSNFTIRSHGGSYVETLLGVSMSGTTVLLADAGDLAIGTFAAKSVVFGTNNAERMRISSAGGLSVGTTADPGAGAIYATGNITAYYSSDKRLKENIRDIPDALSVVTAIGGKLFDWTDAYIESKGGEDGYFVRKSDFGVVAQDVEEVFPQAVREREDGMLAVDYEKLCALAFAAIRELKAEVDAMKAH